MGTTAPMAFVDLAAQRERLRSGIDAANAQVLDHGQFIMGPEVAELEEELGTFSGAKHVISCASGTDALMLALLPKGLQPGDAGACPELYVLCNCRTGVPSRRNTDLHRG